jgi:hypothetical protein
VPIRDIRAASRIDGDANTGRAAGRMIAGSGRTGPRRDRIGASAPGRRPTYHFRMTRFYSIDDANDRLVELRPVLERLRAQRADLVALRDLAVDRISAIEVRGEAGGRGGTTHEDDAELRRIRMRMQGIVDQMQAAVGQIDDWGVTLRDIESGLIDFPALVSGRQVWLCWRLGEDDVDWWHEMTTGFDSRQPLSELR